MSRHAALLHQCPGSLPFRRSACWPRAPWQEAGGQLLCRVSDTGRLMIYRPVLMAGVRKPSGKEPAGGGVGDLLSMGICRDSVLGRGCTGRRNGRRTDDRGRDFVAAPAVGGVFLA